MLISYQSQLLQEICFHSTLAVQQLGVEAEVCLQARHSVIQAARNVFELLVGGVTIEGNLCTLSVPDVLSIVIAPNYGDSGYLYDWSTVERIKVMGINDVR